MNVLELFPCWEVYNAARGISHSNNPRESGAKNTITRAELAAIASALPLTKMRPSQLTAKPASVCLQNTWTLRKSLQQGICTVVFGANLRIALQSTVPH